MDKRTEHILSRMSKRVPKEIRSKLVEQVGKYDDDFKDSVRRMADLKRIPKHIRASARAMLESGELDAKKDVVNKDIERKWDERLTSEMNKAIRRGEIPAPSAEDRRFLKEREARIAKEKAYGASRGVHGGGSRGSGPIPRARP